LAVVVAAGVAADAGGLEKAAVGSDAGVAAEGLTKE
jgi:hypothetical protein